MRNLTVILFLLLVQIVFGQTNYFLLPQGHDFNLYQRTGEDLEKLEQMKFHYTELYAFDRDELVIVNNDSTKFHYGKIRNNRFQEEIVQDFPTKFMINTIELKDGMIYLGGSWNSGELFYLFDIQNRKFHSVPIPEKVYQPGKAIDDILFYEDKIIAVDNILVPKYLIFYNMEELPNLNSTLIVELKSNGTYEHISKGQIFDKYLLLLSNTTSGYIGMSDHLTILSTEDFTTGFSVDSRRKPGFQIPTLKWNDAILWKDKLFIASKEKGIGVLKIKESYLKQMDYKNSDDVFLNNKVSSKKIKYFEKTELEPIKLIPFSEHKILVIYQDGDNSYIFKMIDVK